MPTIDLKTNHKAIKDYYAGLEEFHRLGVTHETAVRAAFQRLLEHCCKQAKWTFIGEYKYLRKGQRPLSVDGAALDGFKIAQAYWEAKDTQDDLPREVHRKFEKGYPRNNIVFQSPDRAILWQDSRQILDEDITKPDTLVYVVKELFAFRSETQRDWEVAVEEFKPHIPAIAAKVVELIEVERKENKSFVQSFNSFSEVCRSSINPNLSDAAVEEMLVQHLLTERIFRRVFHNSEFTDRNIIAREIERVIHALTSRKFSREEFLKPLDRFYGALEKRAETLDDYGQQQTFLNTVYEKFFQGFAVKVADTHGIVYTPQPIVDFMVRSVEEILKKEFGKSLSDEGVHIIDPFVGTGNFITRIMRAIKKTALPHKYANELHCNEVMLLPYYIASMNIEHEYYERTAEYKPFEGICLVDTFELAEDKQLSLMFTQENTERVERLRRTKLFVIIGNPPYNTAQVSENDNNKNRKYRIMDARVSHTYGYDSTASNKNKLADPYVKAIRWASDKVLENGEGIVAFVSNNSFVDEVTFDGVRKHLGADFDLVYVVDLKGNIRKDSMRDGVSLGEKHTVFGLSAMVGVCISFFIKKKKPTPHQIYYWDTDFRATRAEKFGYLDNAGNVYELANVVLEPDQKHNWITTGFKTEFGYFMPLGAKDSSSIAAQSIFRSFSLGLNSNRDAWVYNHNCSGLRNNMEKSIDFYNRQVYEWTRTPPATDIDGFVVNDDSVISWSSSLKNFLKRGVIVSYDGSCLREAMYRPFCKLHLYYGKHFIHRRGLWQSIFPHSESEAENRVICTTGIGSRKPFHALVTNVISDLHLLSDTQCFPFYVYDEDGKNRRQNITEWAVEQFSSTLGSSVDRWQIFYFVYGLFHAPSYREKYQANLRRELPRIPIPKSMEQFLAFASAGERLAGLHVNYESQPEYPIERLENPDRPLSWRVAKMKFTKDKTAIVYNDFLILAGIPAEAFEYHLRNRPALEWIVDQYQVRTDKRSGIVLVQRKMDRRLFFLDSRG